MRRIYKLHSDGTSLERLVKIGENIKNVRPLGRLRRQTNAGMTMERQFYTRLKYKK